MEKTVPSSYDENKMVLWRCPEKFEYLDGREAICKELPDFEMYHPLI